MKIVFFWLILILTRAFANGEEIRYSVIENSSGKKIEGLSVEVEKKDEESVVRLINSSKFSIAISKHAGSWTVDLKSKDESKSINFGNVNLVSIDSLDHVILAPGKGITIYKIGLRERKHDLVSYVANFGCLGLKNKDYMEVRVTFEVSPFTRPKNHRDSDAKTAN